MKIKMTTVIIITKVIIIETVSVFSLEIKEVYNS